MTTSRLPRRAIVGAVLAASIVGGGLVAAFAADPPACTTFTDPKGDSAPADAPMLPAGDDDLDLTGVAFDTLDTNLNVSVYVAGLDAAAPKYSFGDYFTVTFKDGDKAVDLYAYRYNPTQLGDGASNFYDQTGMDVNSAAATTAMKVTYDTTASRVLFSLPLADLEKETGVPAAGAVLSTLTAQSDGDDVLIGEPWDDAAAPKDTTYTVGTACGGGGSAPVATAPAPSPSPTPSATPTATIPPAGGAGDPSKLPQADCFLAKDLKGDAHTPNANVPNDPDLDLTNLTLGSDAKNLYAYLKVDALAAGPQIHEGHRFYVSFTHNKHNFTMAGSAYKDDGSAQLKDGLAQTGQVAHVTQLAVDGVSNAADPARFTGAGPGFVDSGLKFVFDQKSSTVTAILPIADMEKYGKAPAAGAVLTGIYGGSFGDAYAVAQQADAIPDGATSPATSKLTYTIGDNHCFGGGTASSPLTYVGALKVQYGDTAAVAAKLVDAAGKPLAGQVVTFSLGASKTTGKTAGNGVARAALVVKDKAGKRSLTISGAGATTTVAFTVLVEKAVLTATGTKGAVTASLRDDDRHPVAGQVITFALGSKKVTARTDAKGVAKATGLPPGNVKVTYAGAPGMYTAATATTKP